MFVIIFILGIIFKISAVSLDNFFNSWLNNGLRLTDQQRIMDQFWKEIGPSRRFNQENLPLVYLDTEKTITEDGAFFAETIVWRLATLFDLQYKDYKQGRFALCTVEILGKNEFDKYIRLGNDGKSIISNKCGKIVYKPENFFAFSLENRDLIPERIQVLKDLGIE